MRSNIILFSCIFLIITVKSFGQVTFTSRPSSLQLYARQSADSASVSITGQVNITGYSKVIFTMFKNGILADSSISTLSYSAGKAAFAHTYRIHAEKSFYRFIMYTYNGSALQVMRADSVCSGDVYLINGQSNAIALLNTFVSDTVNTWVRSFGSNSPLAAECLADTSWGLAIGGTGTHHAGIGVWAYRLGKMIADSTGIPVCFVNGAKFGSRINEHLPIANHADVNSIYGRLYYRASKAKITASIKGLFWYQGESDGDTAYVQYSSRFSILYNSWKQDYPGLSKITVMQTRPGCIAGSTFIYHQQLREIQRTLAATYTDVTLTTTVAIPNFDGCHFLYSGYYQLAQQLYNQLSDDFYNKPAVMNSDPPRLLEARYTNNSNTELSLLFSQHVIYPSIYSGYNLKNYFYLNSTTTIISGSASGDTIKLQLSTSCNVNKITYLPTIYYSGSTSTYQGPWLVNTANVGVPSFYQFPINNVLTIKGSFCAADSTVLSTNRAGQDRKSVV